MKRKAPAETPGLSFSNHADSEPRQKDGGQVRLRSANWLLAEAGRLSKLRYVGVLEDLA